MFLLFPYNTSSDGLPDMSPDPIKVLLIGLFIMWMLFTLIAWIICDNTTLVGIIYSQYCWICDSMRLSYYEIVSLSHRIW
jgi:hypothetical protein